VTVIILLQRLSSVGILTVTEPEAAWQTVFPSASVQSRSLSGPGAVRYDGDTGEPTGVRFMMRLVVALVSSLFLAGAAESAEVKIWWHGQSFFVIESSKGTRVAIDPHAIEAYGRKEVSADLVLVSHLHSDHDQVGVIRRPVKVLYGLKASGRRLDWNPIDESYRDVHVRSVGVYHDTTQGMERGKNTVFVIEVDGLRIVHLGDLGHLLTPKEVRQIGPVDVLMIPVGGVYTINGAEAKQVVEQLGPRRYILPMHYGTRVFSDLLPADEFLEEQKNVRRFPGNKLVVDTGVAPSEPVIAILDWRS
jgi:L-ascorbate metabolism protein UlaG (beta-lactamase superfamily)